MTEYPVGLRRTVYLIPDLLLEFEVRRALLLLLSMPIGLAIGHRLHATGYLIPRTNTRLRFRSGCYVAASSEAALQLID